MIASSAAMAAAIESGHHRPDFKVLSYDISSDTGETWGSIIDGTSVQTPFDLTPYLSEVRWSYDKLTFAIADEILRFHPDSGDLTVNILQGRGIRLHEGFSDVAEAQWLPTFTGIIQGTYTWNLVRGTNPQATISVQSRESNQAWHRRFITSKQYTIGTDYSVLFNDIAKTIMSLEDVEVLTPTTWNFLFDKQINQIVNISPWEGLVGLTQGGLLRLWFNGNGQLATYPLTVDRAPVLTLTNDRINSYTQPGTETQVVNKVIVTYLDNVLTRVDGARASLGTANVTAGFFDKQIKLDVKYSDDGKQRADQVKLVTKTSINQNDLGISIGSETLVIDDEFGGELVIDVDAFVSGLAVAGIAAVLTSAKLPDKVQVGPTGTGVTIPLGRLVEAAGIVAVMIALMILGTGVYEVEGVPYDFAFLEKRAIALMDNILFWEEVTLEIRNEFISTEEHAHSLALQELLFEQSKLNPRNLVIQYDPRIERGDILELPGALKFFVLDAGRQLQRGAAHATSLGGVRTSV
jgi:hypothetical protein